MREYNGGRDAVECVHQVLLLFLLCLPGTSKCEWVEL